MDTLLSRDDCVCNGAAVAHRYQGTGWLLGGLALAGLSAAVNVRHAIGAATEIGDIAEAGALAVVVSLGFITLPAFGFRMAREGARALAVGACVGALICGAVSFTNLVGAAMKPRLAAAVEAKDEASRRTEARNTLDAAEVALANVGTARPTATIQSEIAAKIASRGDLDGCEAKWLPSSRARLVCIEVNKLRAEHGTAARREALERTAIEARAALASSDGARTLGSADTAAIVMAAKLLGWSVSAEVVNLVKGVGSAFGVELLGALMMAGWERSRGKIAHTFTDCGASGGHGAHVCSPVGAKASGNALDRRAEMDAAQSLSSVIAPDATALPADAVPPDVSRRVQPLQIPADPAGRLLLLVAERGGEVFGGHRSFARALGISHGHVGNVLADLSSAGKIETEASKRGTRVRLIGT